MIFPPFSFLYYILFKIYPGIRKKTYKNDEPHVKRHLLSTWQDKFIPKPFLMEVSLAELEKSLGWACITSPGDLSQRFPLPYNVKKFFAPNVHLKILAAICVHCIISLPTLMDLKIGSLSSLTSSPD